jgi:REP element-mobilizing transposase RayT
MKPNMGETLAYLLTWTTYGTWLHGDPRGSVDRHNACQGMEYRPPDPARQQAERRRMKSPEVILSDDQRTAVERAIQECCTYRDWQLIALGCRSNHVHVLVHTDGTLPGRVMNELKAYATRGLRQAGLAGPQRLWTRGGSTRYLKSQAALDSAVQYVRFQ